MGKKAEYGGDAVKNETRSFGILYQGGDQGFDIDFFKSEFAKYGGKRDERRSRIHVPPGTSQADATALAQEQMPTLMAKLKDSGVTTIIEVLDARYGMRPGMLAATSAEYFPEWLIGSGGPSGGGASRATSRFLVRCPPGPGQADRAHIISWAALSTCSPPPIRPVPVVARLHRIAVPG